jgi:hypothetical protein
MVIESGRQQRCSNIGRKVQTRERERGERERERKLEVYV